MMGRDGSGNTLAPNLTLKLDALLQNFPLAQRKDESTQVTFLILRNISNLRHVYHFYCTIGHNRVQSTKSEMTRLQFWRFIIDSHLHHYDLSLPEMDRIIAPCLQKGSIHQPTERLSLSDFLSSITILSFIIFKDKIKKTNNKNGKSKNDRTRYQGTSSSGRSQTTHNIHSYVLAQCLQMLITEHIMKHAGRVRGGFLFDPRRAINALSYMEGSWKVYISLCETHSREPTLRMRKLLLALKDFQIIGPLISSDAFLKILASDNPKVYAGGVYNLEIEITFLEYFEALLACAVACISKEMLQQPFQFASPRRFQKSHTTSKSARSSLGHNRPGSAYSRHTSARSAKSVSSQPSSIASIGEDESVMESETTTIKSETSGEEKVIQESMETALTGIQELEINDLTKQSTVHRTTSVTSIDMSSIFDDMDDDDDEDTASSRKSKGSSPEVLTAEMEEKEKQFMTWSSQLNIFFTRYLLPAWQKAEMLRRETARHRRK